MTVIEVKSLKKYYRVYKKEIGLLGSLKAIFNRHYAEVKAVDDISFKIEEGELVGFIGPNGTGKTTNLKCLSGLLYSTTDFVSVLGFLPHQRKPEFLRQISLVMGQKNQLWWDLPPLETFELNKEVYEIPEEKYKQTLNEKEYNHYHKATIILTSHYMSDVKEMCKRVIIIEGKLMFDGSLSEIIHHYADYKLL